jgi:hypothetical protein
MAKKSFTTPDDLVSALEDLSAPKPVQTRSKLFSQMEGHNARDIALATGDRTMAGQYKRKQILIAPAQLDYVRDKARELGLSQAALFRWLIDYGLSALDAGIAPEVEIVAVRGEAKLSHWTSNS